MALPDVVTNDPPPEIDEYAAPACHQPQRLEVGGVPPPCSLDGTVEAYAPLKFKISFLVGILQQSLNFRFRHNEQ